MSKYNEIMEHITVTDEMRERVIANVKASQKRKRINMILRITSAAAACAVIAVGTVVYFRTQEVPVVPDGTPVITAPITEPTDTQSIFDYTEYASAEELSEAFGVKMHDVSVPFDIAEKHYGIITKNIAEIQYISSGEQDSAIRVGTAGMTEEEVTGVYDEYTDIKEIDVNGEKVTIKGYDGKYSLAVWTKDERIHCVFMRVGISEKQMTDIITEAE